VSTRSTGYPASAESIEPERGPSPRRLVRKNTLDEMTVGRTEPSVLTNGEPRDYKVFQVSGSRLSLSNSQGVVGGFRIGPAGLRGRGNNSVALRAEFLSALLPFDLLRLKKTISTDPEVEPFST
jgi:hypothetical protein